MKLSVAHAVTVLLMPAIVMADSVPWERLDKNNSALLIIDLQEGLYNLGRDFDPTLFRDNIIAHAAIAKPFGLPVVMTSSAQSGPNGVIPSEILNMYPDAPLIKRNGEVDAWDNAEFRAAVKATGKTQLIIAGLATDVCTTFLALSLRAEGYSVWANAEASGTTTTFIRDISNDRMARAGVQVVSHFAIVTDLMRDWRNTPGAAELFPFFDKYYPAYGMVARGHAAAVRNGTVLPGEAVLPA